MRFKAWLIFVVVGALSGSRAFANLGADALLKTVDPKAVVPQENSAVVPQLNLGKGEYQLSDPFLIQLYSQWRLYPRTPYDLNRWVQLILKAQYVQATHLWSVVAKQVPSEWEHMVRATQSYLLWKLELPQTFFEHWVASLTDPDFVNSPGSRALLQTITDDFDEFLWEMAIIPTEQQKSILSSLDSNNRVFLFLQAFLKLRQGKEAIAILKSLPADNALTPILARTASLALAREGDLSGSARILKEHMEKALIAQKNPKLLATHYLQIARLLYQAGSLEGAEQFYEKVPSGTENYLTAREELLWVWLRLGNIPKLRGALKTLGSQLFEDTFAPDVYVVRAIANLKLCYYDQVQKELQTFTKDNKKWAKQIEAALESQSPKVPFSKDLFLRYAQTAVEVRAEEQRVLDELYQHSLSAALPAVGRQNHWEVWRKNIVEAHEKAKKVRDEEYHRQWKNHRLTLSEAIKKMQFVRVEFLSQLRAFAKEKAGEKIASADTKQLDQKKGQLSFPYDGVVWPDELFNLQSLAQSRCLAMIGATENDNPHIP